MNDNNANNDALKNKAMQLFLRHYNYVQSVAMKHAPAAHLQEDIVNDVFLDFIAKSDQWRYADDIRPLLRVITEKTAQKYWRDYLKNMPETLRKLATHLRTFVEENVREDETDLNEQLQALSLCLNKLTPHNRELIDSYYYGNRSLVEISEYTQINYATLCKAVLRIRSTLRHCIENVLKGAHNAD